MRGQLRELSTRDFERVREAFTRGGHMRFLKFLNSDLPFGHKEDYKKAVRATGVVKLGDSSRYVGFYCRQRSICSGPKNNPAAQVQKSELPLRFPKKKVVFCLEKRALIVGYVAC